MTSIQTVEHLANQANTIITELNVLQSNIQDSFKNIGTSPVINSQIENLNSQADIYDQEFEQEEAKIQAMGGKTRAQTLQEFVLLFFYISLLLLIISITIYTFATTKNIKETLKVFGMLAFSAFIITGLLIRSA
jgi:hypothetical protein